MSLRWNGGVLGKPAFPNTGMWSLPAHSNLVQRKRWPYPLPVTSNLILHIDASNANTVTLNGTSVSAITDLSTSGLTVDQTTAARQPAYTINARNGRNAITFTGSSQHFLNLTSTTIPASHTVFHVVNRTAAGTILFGIGSTSVAQNSLLWSSDNATYQNSNGTIVSFGSANPSVGWFYITTRRNGTTQLRMRRNGTTLADVTTGTGITNAASGSWSAIARNNSFYTTGSIGEIIAYDTNLSDSDIDLVEAYLAAKWDI